MLVRMTTMTKIGSQFLPSLDGHIPRGDLEQSILVVVKTALMRGLSLKRTRYRRKRIVRIASD